MSVFFFNLPNPGMDSASNRNEYHESSWGAKGGRRVRPTTLPPSVSRLSGKNMGASTSHNPMSFTACYRDSFTFLSFLYLMQAYTMVDALALLMPSDYSLPHPHIHRVYEKAL
jgi:hypothetical protein